MKLFVIQITGMILLFISNWLIVKNSTEEIYGIYSIIINWLIIIGTITQLGMEDYHIANLPVLKIKNENNTINKIFSWSSRLISLSSLAIMLVLYIIINYLPVNIFHKYKDYFNLGIIIIIFQTLLTNFVSFLRGLNHIVYSQLADKILRPLLFLIFLLISLKNISFNILIIAQVFSLATTLLVIFLLCRRYLKKNTSDLYVGFDKSLKSNFYFLTITLFQLLVTRLDILVLSFLVLPPQIGYYNIAMKFADFSAYPLYIINLVIPTYLAQHNYKNDRLHLYKFMRHALFASFTGVACLLMILFIFGKLFLGIFGENFESAFPVLIILGCSQLISTIKSPVNGLFIVSGREKLSMWCLFLNVIVTAALCFILIPFYGITGAALAILLGNIFHTMLLLSLFYRKEKIIITPFSMHLFKK